MAKERKTIELEARPDEIIDMVRRFLASVAQRPDTDQVLMDNITFTCRALPNGKYSIFIKSDIYTWDLHDPLGTNRLQRADQKNLMRSQDRTN
jgi:hypothetical protein